MLFSLKMSQIKISTSNDNPEIVSINLYSKHDLPAWPGLSVFWQCVAGQINLEFLLGYHWDE